MFPDNGSCKAHRGSAGQGEAAKSHYQPSLSGDPPCQLGKAPHWLFAKGCRSPPEHSVSKEQPAKGQGANKTHPGGHGPKITWYWPCASFFLGREDTTGLISRGIKAVAQLP